MSGRSDGARIIEDGATSGDGSPAVDDLAVRLADLARAMQNEDDVQATLDAIVQATVVNVPGAEHASISVIKRRREVITRASTNDLPRAIDQAQYDTGQGPCLDTLFEQETARMDDLGTEDRWPAFSARARGLGAGSMLCVQLYVDGERGDLGALNVSSEHAHAFTDEGDVDWMDGLTVCAVERWFNLRPSNTLPLLRLIVEVDREAVLAGRVEEVLALIRR